jgi:hypothetical protein
LAVINSGNERPIERLSELSDNSLPVGGVDEQEELFGGSPVLEVVVVTESVSS